MHHLVDLSGISNIIEKQMDQISLITILSIAIVYFLLRPYYLKDIVNYEYKTIADILAFLFLSWVVSTVLGINSCYELSSYIMKIKKQKKCSHCSKEFYKLFRCRYENTEWIFLCQDCISKVKQKYHKSYQYGGTWKSTN